MPLPGPPSSQRRDAFQGKDLTRRERGVHLWEPGQLLERSPAGHKTPPLSPHLSLPSSPHKSIPNSPLPFPRLPHPQQGAQDASKLLHFGGGLLPLTASPSKASELGGLLTSSSPHCEAESRWWEVEANFPLRSRCAWVARAKQVQQGALLSAGSTQESAPL